MQLLEFARYCEQLEKISGRLEMIDLVAGVLPSLDDRELPLFVRFISGRIFPDWSPLKLGIGPNLLYDAITFVVDGTREDVIGEINRLGDVGLAVEKILTRKKIEGSGAGGRTGTATIQQSLFPQDFDLPAVFREFTAIAEAGGKSSQQAKLSHIQNLFQNITPLEGRYLARLLMEDLRIGMGEGNMRDAIARGFGVEPSLVEHAYQAINDLGEVAILARTGARALEDVHIRLFHPVKMMLAQQGTIGETIRDNGAVAAEFKYDGSRFQFHRSKDASGLYSRKLEDVTTALPDIIEALESATGHDVILDGEVIAVRDGKPLPFQTVLRRFRRKYGVESMREEIRLIPHVFDILYLDGETLIDLPLSERRAKLESAMNAHVAPQLVSDDPAEVETFYQQALDAGHEGIMLKVVASPYTPGVRGKNWIKIKPSVDTLDLAVIGADWGEGKRAHYFGSFLLACQDEQGDLTPLSKVATGFSDEQLGEVFDLLKDRVIASQGKEVSFEPGLVFEIGYSEIQKSPNYESGFALRFPRFIRIRDDKSVDEIETLDSVRERYRNQSK
ncbi:DNA ligase-1 [Methanolinea mesophila]|uniref:ATP-dependent DNA ligase n=1 Tax=Methanolinea mesophila TaxID=547055 RepID=UPI001AE2124D|nr:ATP-dependent DNA ligase [Methanolinea mesophila]MBP1929543.1 DNA ligase-1 [Methanolinea mesophila]